MDEQIGWGIDVESCSDKHLVEIIKLLRESKHIDQQMAAQRELIKRLKDKQGLTTLEIVKHLVWARSKKDRLEVAEEWASILGITIQEFRRLAGD